MILIKPTIPRDWLGLENAHPLRHRNHVNIFRRDTRIQHHLFDGLTRHFLPGRFDPPDFALRLAHKDVTLAVEVGREFKVPMRLANLTLEEMTEALNRGWGQRDSRSAMLLQEERAGVDVRVPQEQIDQALEND